MKFEETYRHETITYYITPEKYSIKHDIFYFCFDDSRKMIGYFNDLGTAVKCCNKNYKERYASVI